MKITFITTKLNLGSGGGSHHALHMVASKLADAGNQVSIITILPGLNAFPPDLPYQVISEGGISRTAYTQRDTLTLHNILRKHEKNADIYHLWDPLLIFGGTIYKLLGGKIPLVAYLNGYTFCTNLDRMDAVCYKKCGVCSRIMHRKEKPLRKIVLWPLRMIKYTAEMLTVNMIDAFIAISPAVAEIYSKQHFDKRKMHIISEMIDNVQITRYKERLVSSHFSPECFNIIYVGRLVWLKGVDLLLKSVSKLDFPLNLHIVGDGPQKQELEILTAQLGLSDKVIFHGWVSFEKVIEYCIASQLFVHPARWPEPLGRTILDAMALGLPVIVPNCGGPPWVINDAGLLFRPEDIDDLANKIKSVYNNPSLAEDLGRKAEARAKDFDYKNTIPQFIKLYTGLIK